MHTDHDSDLTVGRTNTEAINFSASSNTQIGVEMIDEDTIVHLSDMQHSTTSHFSNLRLFLDTNQRDALVALLQEAK